ncbi:hypothetical protein BH11BAC5_BH11BAC5_05370 [soil metagenome]
MYQDHSKEEKNKLDKLSALIKNFVTTGWDMFTERMNSKEILKTDLASFLLFRQVLEFGDSLAVLIETGCVNSSKPLVRSMLECYFQLTYLYEKNEDRKALQFLYHYESRQKDYYEKLAYRNKGGSFFEKLKNDRHLKGDDESDERKLLYIENIKKIEETLNRNDNSLIAEEYLRTEVKKKNKVTEKPGKVSNWYELFDGPTSVEGIAIELNEAALYEFIYRSCSSYAHGEDIVHANLESYDESSSKITPLRDLRQLSTVSNNILLLIERACMIFLKYKVGDKVKWAEIFLPIMEEKKKYY